MVHSRRAATPRYIELRCRSAFSFLAGASLPEDLIAQAAALGYPALALGDRDGVYGAPRFHRAATAAGLRALVGAELTLAQHPTAGLLSPLEKGRRGGIDAPSLYLLVANRTGYQNLCRLITHTKLRAPKGEAVVTWADLEEAARGEGATINKLDGLICLAGGQRGPLAAALARRSAGASPLPRKRGGEDRPPAADQRWTVDCLIARLQRLFPNRLYIDIQRHLDPEEERLNRALIAVAEHSRIPLVATNDVRHATRAGRRLLDILTCIRNNTTLDAAGRKLLQNAERHLKSPAEMAALFRDLPAAIAHTQRIAEQCEFTLANLGYRFPDYPLPAGETPIGYLRALTFAGARERYGTITPRVRGQLEHELAVIGKLDLAGYFLIVWDIMRFCRAQHILAQGRGSAANSAVCYALGITAIDAVGMDLLFERFLSEERGEWPDIDIDLPSGDQREKVIQYVYQRYGARGAAMTANAITYRTRSAVREVGKALGFSLVQVDRLSKLLRRFEFRDASDDLVRQLKAGGVDPKAPRVQLLVDLVQQIQNLPRHLGQHSGGMVIAAGRLDTVVPLEPAAMPGRVVVQWDKDDCADLGIIKIDLLGLGMMAVLEEAISLVHAHEGVALDLAHLPPDDPQVYAMLRRADTIGVFQVESRAQMATLPRMRPEHFYDLVVEVAIIRPGPIVGQMVHPYLNRRNGREPVTYAHPDLEPILRRTLGVPLFQEQLLRMAMTLAGFTGGEAEELRRAMGFKRSVDRMQAIEVRLRRGMAARGITGKTAEDIIRSITSFALYGFPESHAASFALLAYASAYLRAHHLAAFTCAMLNNWPLGFYHPATLVKDAQRHGLRVLPIDVTRSRWTCSLEQVVGLSSRHVAREDHIQAEEATMDDHQHPTPHTLATSPPCLRLGLRYVRGLREEVGRRIEQERADAPFSSLADVVRRCGLRDNEAQALAHIGAFAAFGLTRRQALWQVAAVPKERLLGCYGVRVFGDNASGILATNSLVSRGGQGRTDDGPAPRAPDVICPLPDMSLLERTLADYKGAGVTVGPQIMKHLRAALARVGVLRASDLRRAHDGQWAKIAGLVIVRQRPGTAKGFCFLTLEDETGTANAVVMPGMFQRHRSLIHTAALLQVEGPVQKVDGVIHVRARRFQQLRVPHWTITQRGSGYRMRTTPEDGGASAPNDQQPNNEQPDVLPKSHDFR
ncbi:MAG: DNA polymerase III subunit alpha [Candidatus Binatia bacterium]